jgi:hypothetical protein
MPDIGRDENFPQASALSRFCFSCARFRTIRGRNCRKAGIHIGYYRDIKFGAHSPDLV